MKHLFHPEPTARNSFAFYIETGLSAMTDCKNGSEQLCSLPETRRFNRHVQNHSVGSGAARLVFHEPYGEKANETETVKIIGMRPVAPLGAARLAD